MVRKRKKRGYMARRELLYDFVEILTIACALGAVLIALYLRFFVWRLF